MKRYIRSSGDWDDIMGGCKYRVVGGPAGDYAGDYDEEFAKYYGQKPFKTVYTDDPKEAISSWFTAESKFPMDAAIFTNNDQYARELCQWVVDNESNFNAMYEQSNCSYKYEYLMQYAEKYANKTQIHNDFPDQIMPFCYG